MVEVLQCNTYMDQCGETGSIEFVIKRLLRYNKADRHLVDSHKADRHLAKRTGDRQSCCRMNNKLTVFIADGLLAENHKADRHILNLVNTLEHPSSCRLVGKHRKDSLIRS